MSRAIRRHHRERLRKRRGGYWAFVDTPGIETVWLTPKEIVIAKMIDTPTPCACWIYRSDRRQNAGLTIQERRAFQKEE